MFIAPDTFCENCLRSVQPLSGRWQVEQDIAPFDERRVTSVVDELHRSSVQEIASGIADEVSRFAPGEPSDDRTLVVLRRTG